MHAPEFSGFCELKPARAAGGLARAPESEFGLPWAAFCSSGSATFTFCKVLDLSNPGNPPWYGRELKEN